MSSIILRGVSGFPTPSSQTTLGVTFPSNLQVGDFMFLWCATNGSALYSFSDTTDGLNPVTVGYTNGTMCVQLLWKIATATDSANAASATSYAITMSGSAVPWVAVAGAYGGVNQTNPFDFVLGTSGNLATSTTITATGITTMVPNDQLLWFGASGATGGVPTITGPSGYTARISQASTSTGSNTQICALFADNTFASTGWTGNAAGTLSASHGNAGLLLALIPRNPTLTFNFESGLQGFTPYSGTHVTLVQSSGWARSGSYSALMTTDSTYATPLMTCGAPVIPNMPYYMTAWVMSPAGWASGAKLQADIYTANSGTYISSASGLVLSPLPAGLGLTLPVLKFTMPPGAAWAHVIVAWEGTPSISDELYVDDVMFGPYQGNGGIMPNRHLL